MNPIVKGWWVGALSAYQQGHGYLHRINNETGQHSFCPSGVLVDLYQRSVNQQLPVTVKKMTKDLSIVLYDGNGTALPPQVAAWAGLPNQYPSIVLPSGRHWLISVLNDAGYEFDYISSVIEEYIN